MTTPPSAPSIAGSGPLISIRAVRKTFGGVPAVTDLSLDLRAGEFFALLGPSGCGKTTLLRMIAGFEEPDAGQILLDGRDIAHDPPYRRPVNMMFQSYALFPHMSVGENIAFGLKREGLARAEIASRVAEMLRLGRLEGFEGRKPHQLSGGQRQRVALARALARRPRVLLLDEPLAALDKQLREDTQFELKDVQRRLGLTFVIVTHDQDEAMSLADRIGVMQAGRLAQVGPPEAIYERPANRYVAGFVGDINLFDAEVTGGGAAVVQVSVPMLGHVLPINSAVAFPAGTAVFLAVRPETIAFLSPNETADCIVEGRVSAVSYLGNSRHYRVVTASGGMIRVALANGASGSAPAVGAAVRLGFSARAAVLVRD